MNAMYDEAIMRGDAAALDRMFADEFIYTSPKCEVLGKKEQIANLTAHDFRLEDEKSDNVRDPHLRRDCGDDGAVSREGAKRRQTRNDR